MGPTYDYRNMECSKMDTWDTLNKMLSPILYVLLLLHIFLATGTTLSFLPIIVIHFKSFDKNMLFRNFC